jgi:hypothetical protein
MNADSIGLTFAWIGFGVIAIAVVTMSIIDMKKSQGPKERRFVLLSNLILWSLLLLAAIFMNLKGFIGMIIYYFAAKALNQRRLDIRMDEGIDEQRKRFPPQQGLSG